MDCHDRPATEPGNAPSGEVMIVVPFRLDATTSAALDAATSREGLTHAAAVRDAITRWLDAGEDGDVSALAVPVTGGVSTSVRLPAHVAHALANVEDGAMTRSDAIRCALRHWLLETGDLGKRRG